MDGRTSIQDIFPHTFPAHYDSIAWITSSLIPSRLRKETQQYDAMKQKKAESSSVVLFFLSRCACCDELMQDVRDKRRGNKCRFVLRSFTQRPFRFKLGLAGFCQWRKLGGPQQICPSVFNVRRTEIIGVNNKNRVRWLRSRLLFIF